MANLIYNFFVFFLGGGAQPRVGDFVVFLSVIFHTFGMQEFLGSVPAPQARKGWGPCLSLCQRQCWGAEKAKKEKIGQGLVFCLPFRQFFALDWGKSAFFGPEKKKHDQFWSCSFLSYLFLLQNNPKKAVFAFHSNQR